MCLELALYQLHPFRTAPSSAAGGKKWRDEQVCAENVELSSRDGALLHEVRALAVGKSRRRRAWPVVEASRVTVATTRRSLPPPAVARCGAFPLPTLFL